MVVSNKLANSATQLKNLPMSPKKIKRKKYQWNVDWTLNMIGQLKCLPPLMQTESQIHSTQISLFQLRSSLILSAKRVQWGCPKVLSTKTYRWPRWLSRHLVHPRGEEELIGLQVELILLVEEVVAMNTYKTQRSTEQWRENFMSIQQST